MNSQSIKVNTPSNSAQQGSGSISNLLDAIKTAAAYYEKSRHRCRQELNACHEAEQQLLKLERTLKIHMQDNQSKEAETAAQLVKKIPRVIVDDEIAVPFEFTLLQRKVDIQKIQKALLKGEKIKGTHLENDSLELNLQIAV